MDKCNWCGTKKCNPSYHKLLERTLCMRCTDKLLSLINDRDVNEYWTDDFAIKEGLDKFPLPSDYVLSYFKKRLELMRPVMKLDYNYRKGYDL
jgi:hypothetical protein